jgi:arginine utilization regulatory protein
MDWKNILSKITAHIDDGVFVVDRMGKVLYYNASANNQAGVSFQNAMGKHILELFPKLSHETSTLLRVMETGMPIIGDIQRYYNHSLKKVTIITNTYPIHEGNQIVGALEISKDMMRYGDIHEKIALMARQSGLSVALEEATYEIDHILSTSPAMDQLKNRIRKIAVSEASVLVIGETGTGKELVVQSIHNLSRRNNMPFIAQNCAAIPITLLESLLFGTSEGGFTGSKEAMGLFELADGGTLFLDEINAMDLSLQAKLLRVIQDGCIRRIGDRHVRQVDVRVMVAMNISSGQALEEGKLRQDLYYRLNVLRVDVPALRHREGDVMLLAHRFLTKFNKLLDKNIEGIDRAVQELFDSYPWPGNVRELEHVMEQAVLLCESDRISLHDLSTDIHQHTKIDTSLTASVTNIKKLSLKSSMDAYEKSLIEAVLKEKEYVIQAAADQLCVPRQTLYNRMMHLGIRYKSCDKMR